MAENYAGTRFENYPTLVPGYRMRFDWKEGEYEGAGIRYGSREVGIVTEDGAYHIWWG